MGFLDAIYMGDFNMTFLAGQIFVCKEIMFQPVQYQRRAI
jgi:hypothetical protein